MITIRRIIFWSQIVWRPVTGDEGDTWFQAWRKYRMKPAIAWEIAVNSIHNDD
jgi:hypothetical protein